MLGLCLASGSASRGLRARGTSCLDVINDHGELKYQQKIHKLLTNESNINQRKLNIYRTQRMQMCI
jgi:hypothetical protein